MVSPYITPRSYTNWSLPQHPKKVIRWPNFRGITSAITDAIRLADGDTIRCYVRHILLIAGALLCVILLIKAVFDRAEARDKSKKEDKKH